MSMAFAVLLAVHGLIHLVGLTRPNPVLWGTAAALFRCGRCDVVLVAAVVVGAWLRRGHGFDDRDCTELD
jgi:hypothetical protein